MAVESKIKKIRQLIELSRRSSFENESNVAMELAESLMYKFSVSRDDLLDSEAPVVDLFELGLFLFEAQTIPLWLKALGCVVANHNHCKAYVKIVDDHECLCIVGEYADGLITRELFHLFETQILLLSMKHMGQKSNSWLQTYQFGIIEEIDRRLSIGERKALQEGLIKRSSDKLESFLKKIITQESSPVTYFTTDAFFKGKEDSGQIDISRLRRL